MLRVISNSSLLGISKLRTFRQTLRHGNTFTRMPTKQGLYNKDLEKDSCGVGIVAHLKRSASRQIVEDANQMLVRMSHRGGCGCEVNTGDGAGLLQNVNVKNTNVISIIYSTGILVGMPDSFYRSAVGKSLGVTLGPLGSYGCGIVFTPKNEAAVNAIKGIFSTQVEERGLKVIGWRKVETGSISKRFRC